MYIRIQYWQKLEESDSVGFVNHVTIDEEKLCELVASDVGQPPSRDYKNYNFAIDKVVID